MAKATGCFLAFGLWITGTAPAISQWASIQGEVFQPTEDQCLEALEGGILIPFDGTNSRERASVYVLHRGNIYLIAIRQGSINIVQLTCQAWELRDQ